MADMYLTQAEADAPMVLAKQCGNTETRDFTDPGERLEIPLVSLIGFST